MSVYGQDWSSYQSASPDTSGLAFAFIKVTQGLSYTNPSWVSQRAAARKAGLVVGFYHYPNIANSPAAEADHFLSQINLVAGDILCLDWEWYGQNVTNAQARAYKDAWLAYVKAKVPGHKVGIYCDTGNWKNVDTNSNCGDFLWIADYTTAGQPRVQHPWTFHQYTDSPLDKDIANFATAADLKAWAGVGGGSGGGGSTAGAEIYPGASKAHWYSTAYPGDPMTVNTIVWHSTETLALPDYSGGSIAPTLTAVPDFKTQKLVWYQHFGFDESARALVHDKTQIGTNTLNVAQVEIVGTCDPTTHATWSKAGTEHLYMPELPDWAIADLNAFAHWAHDQHGVPLTSGLTWKPYPASYGNNGVRMDTAAWSAFKGHCGHQHVPQNDHGDPGQFPIAQILEADMPLTDADAQKVALAVLGYRNADAEKKNPNMPDVYGYIAGTSGAVASLTAQVGALSGAITALTKSGGITAEQVQAAAAAGAKAALDELASALGKAGV
ncbi:glycoside hydrolase family 25 protein [Streptomyces hygroscopicus]|uniref:glycoside hydrolase family 25 protein n=1 Tax=Streptomyces hygroscopicus TaxID=1912 RepID=UPI00223FC46A|nr:glycoside hydrolase family 25 protein [Streptomyces hygroscopicus]